MMMLIERPDLQDRLRRDRSLIPKVFDETLGLEPPVVSLFRVCTPMSNWAEAPEEGRRRSDPFRRSKSRSRRVRLPG